MHIFVTGGSGLTGPAVVAELIANGHTVTGLARSDEAAARLTAIGAAVHRGSLDDLDSLRTGAEGAEGVLHMGFGGSFNDPDDLIRRDRTAIETLGHVLEGSGRPLVITSGTLVMTAGRLGTESDAPDPHSIAYFRIPGEEACLAFAGRGVRASVVRLAPTVHGPGDYGFIPTLIAAARRTGVSAYIGDGENRWPAIHRLDAARLFRLVIEKAPAGSALHGAGEGGIRFKDIAETIARTLGIPVVSVAPEDAAAHFENPFLARAYSVDNPVSSAATQALLGWTPTHATLQEDIEFGDYCTASPSSYTIHSTLQPASVTGRTIRFYSYGEPVDVLKLEEAVIPLPGSDRVRVRVDACGLNPADWALCRGLFHGDLPRGIGLEVSGTVDAVGAGVTDVRVGDVVLGTPDYAGAPIAGASDYAILNFWTPVPTGLDRVEAAALPMAVETAFRSLENLGVSAGQTVLINGAGTTVGFAAVQMALTRGARVIATAGETFAERLRTMGASVTSYGDGMVERVLELAGKAPDLILDTAPVGGVLPDLIKIAGGDPHRVLTITDHAAAAKLGMRASFEEGGKLRYDVVAQFARLAAAGQFTVPVARTFPLEDWQEAMAISQSGRAHGKLVLVLSPPAPLSSE